MVSESEGTTRALSGDAASFSVPPERIARVRAAILKLRCRVLDFNGISQNPRSSHILNRPLRGLTGSFRTFFNLQIDAYWADRSIGSVSCVEEKEAESADLRRLCQGVSLNDELCVYPTTVHCTTCDRWFCDAHAGDDEWHPCVLASGEEGGEA
jgi:hypothetical protein